MAKCKTHLVGVVFGRLTVIEMLPAISGYRIRCRCMCECWREKITIAKSLKNGDTQSCGCFHKERTALAKTIHGETRTPTWRTWVSMKNRCYTPSCSIFKHYGGRGIRICDAWRDDFSAFLRDVGPRPSRRHSLGRPDSSRNYEPGNVFWATRKELNRIHSRSRLVAVEEMTEPMSEWCRLLNIGRTAPAGMAKRLGFPSSSLLASFVTQRIEHAYLYPNPSARRSRYRSWLQ